MNKKEYTITIDRLQERGYGVGVSDDGKEIHCLNALPGEQVVARIFKKKGRSYYAHAIEHVITSPHRVEAKENHFCSCSPFQILGYEEELSVKKQLIYRSFLDEGVPIDSELAQPVEGESWRYRNKVEFSFFKDQGTISLAFFKREGNYGKYPLTDCVLLPKKIIEVGNLICDLLQNYTDQIKDFKGLMIRYSKAQDQVVGQLYSKKEFRFSEQEFQRIEEICQGFQVVLSNTKSPAFLVDNMLQSFGETDLVEHISGLKLQYPIHSFFQVNTDFFQLIVEDILTWSQQQDFSSKTMVDLYGGVGTLGLLLAEQCKNVISIDITADSKKYVELNAALNSIENIRSVETSDEQSLSYIKDADVVIVDPPRIGLHKKVIHFLNENPKEYLIYLSCNPKTQARDLRMLEGVYEITFSKGYNLFPHTPHIEHLMILKSK